MGPILLLNHPEEFNHFIEEFQSETGFIVTLVLNRYPFALIFVKSAEEITGLAAKVDKLLEEDGVFWVGISQKRAQKI